MRPPVEVRQGPNASSSVSTGNSLIPSSCEVKLVSLGEVCHLARDYGSRSPGALLDVDLNWGGQGAS